MNREQVKRLMTEYNTILDVMPELDIILIDGDLQVWHFECDAYFNGKMCEVEVRVFFHIGWPAEPPGVEIKRAPKNFKHPNVYEKSRICISPWKSETTAIEIIKDIKETLAFPSVSKIVDLHEWIRLSKTQTL